jgi:hypothetical protein
LKKELLILGHCCTSRESTNLLLILLLLAFEKYSLKYYKAIAFTFRPLLTTYFIFEKEAKNSKKVRL